MTPIPYLTVTELEAELTLRRIDCPLTVHPGTYRVRVDNAWVELHAVEPRITTGAAPIRAVVLRGASAAVESLVRLEAVLRSTGNPVHLEGQDHGAFSIAFGQLATTLFLHGHFHHDRQDPEVQYRISLPDGLINGFAIDRERERRRVLALTELSIGDEQALARAFATGHTIDVDAIS